jgi:hypothetical protein
VPKAVYERHRHLARAEPLLLAWGRLECSQDVLNVIVRELAALEGFLAGGVLQAEGNAATARIHHLADRAPSRVPEAFPPADAATEEGGAEVGSSMRAVAPPVQSFAMGRRR